MIVEAYRIINKKLAIRCEQTDARHENIIQYGLKPRSKLQVRPFVYSTFQNVYNCDHNVCGVYVPLIDVYNKDYRLHCHVIIPCDYFFYH